jgi:GNAT superfamily N-acetyltransferase
MITFQVEPFGNLIRDGQEIFKTHYEELALHKEAIPLGMDFDMYLDMEKMGVVHVLTARADEKLVGYYIALIVKNHPHNKDAGPAATTDMFYMLPSHRRGGAGAKLLVMAEKMLRDRGVKKATISTKVKFSNRELLEALGWEHTDVVFQKVLA